MKREEAIKIIEANCSCSDSKLREACAMFIPELRESEDEKTYREIYSIVHHSYQQKIDNLVSQERKKEQLDKWEKAKAWLEKQKEHKPTNDSDFKTKLAEYLQNNSPKDGQYVISSESILQMAKEELIKRGELKEQKPIWKPSVQQMKELRSVAYYCGNSSLSPYSISNKTLASLYNDLQRITI